MRRATPPPYTAQFVAQPKSIGQEGEMALTIVEYDRPHRLHNVVRSSYLKVDGTLIFDHGGAATRLRWNGTSPGRADAAADPCAGPHRPVVNVLPGNSLASIHR